MKTIKSLSRSYKQYFMKFERKKIFGKSCMSNRKVKKNFTGKVKKKIISQQNSQPTVLRVEINSR